MSDQVTQSRLAGWFRQWRTPLRRFLIGRSAVPAADLDDVAQEVFLRLMRYDRTELIEHPQAYLYKMAANVAAEWTLRGRHVQPLEAQWLAGRPTADQAEDPAGRLEVQQEIECALLTLSPRQREVLRLQFFEDLSRIQIAERLGTTERSVKRILMKSYEKLRDQLDAELLRGFTDGRE